MRPSSPPEWVQRLDRLHLLTPLRVLLVVIVAVLLTIVIRRIVSRALRPVFDRAVPADRPRADARYRALSTSLRAAVVGVVWAMAVITIVSEVGINIGGFVATATVIGGAIAFGAQTLIRDVISGFFVLADDQFGVGDEVDLGLATGVVERVTLRTAKLRDAEGRIWYVAHGNVLRVANLSKASIAFLDVEVDRSMSLDDAVAAMTELVQQLTEHETAGSLLEATPVVVGITDLTDDRMVLRATAGTQLGRRDEVKRVWRTLLLKAFEAGRLKPPPPRRQLEP